MIKSVEQLRLLIEEKRRELTEINIKIDETNQLISRIQLLENDVVEVNQMFQAFIIKNGIQDLEEIILLSPIEGLKEYVLRLRKSQK